MSEHSGTDLIFEELVRKYEKPVYTVCYQFLRDDAAAEDLTQETFLSAYLHLSACPAGFEKPWLIRIAAKKAKDFLQSAYRRHTVLPGEDAMPPGPTAPSPEELLLAGGGAAQIAELISALREPYRSVCRLHLLEEKSPAETALELGRPLKTVHTQIARGKILLREQLERSGIHGNSSG